MDSDSTESDYYGPQNILGYKDFETLLSQKSQLSMSFPDGSVRSDETFQLKRQVMYTLKFSENISGQYDLIVIRKNYPYVPISTCPFQLPTMPNVKFREIALTHDNVTHYGVTFTAESCNTLSIRFLDTSSMLSQKDRQMNLAFRRAKQIQLLLFSHGPTTLLAKVNLQVVAEIRPEGQKRRRSDSDSNSGSKDREEESNGKKKDLVVQLCRLFNTRGTSLEVEDLSSILNLSKSLINKSNSNV